MTTVDTTPKKILDKLTSGVAVSATNLDVRDLTSASDSVEVKQATASNLKAEISLAAGTGLPSLGYGSTDAGTTWVPMTVDAAGHLQVDVLGGLVTVPIGAVLPWLKSYTNTPALPAQFVECNGQVLSDAESVYNGQTIPNLNGSNYFVRGNSTSGGTGGATTHQHSYSGTTGYAINVGGIEEQFNTDVPNDGHNHDYSGITGAGSSLPPYYNVVWIMRIK